MKDKRKEISEEYPDVPFLFMDPKEFDEAIMGVSESFGSKLSVAYDYDKIININMSMGMDESEAIEYYNFNQVGSYVGEYTPIFIHKCHNC